MELAELACGFKVKTRVVGLETRASELHGQLEDEGQEAVQHCQVSRECGADDVLIVDGKAQANAEATRLWCGECS